YHLAFPTLASLLRTPLQEGLRGILLDGEVGLLWYTPVLLLVAFAWLKFHRRHPNESWLCVMVSGVSLIFFSKYALWHGGWSYGPRLLVPTLPFFVVPIAEVLQQVTKNSGERQAFRGQAAFVTACVGLSVVVQILGLTSSVGRYYSLKEFYEVSRKQPWWGGV